MQRQKFLSSIFGLLLVILFTNLISSGAEFEKKEQIISVKTDKSLFVSLKIDAGKVKVSKNNQPDQVSISIRYDKEIDMVDINYDERKNELLVSIDRDRWFKSWDDHRSPQLELLLPNDVPIELKSKIKAGESEFDLGALKLKEFELRNFAGEVKVDFSSPNKIEMELMDINVKVGETTLNHLSNAQFHNARINGGIGELSIDFSGEGLSASRAEIDLDIGEASIYLPHELGVRFDSSTFGFLTQSNIDYDFMKKGRYYISENYETAIKTMNITINSGIGELRVCYR